MPVYTPALVHDLCRLQNGHTLRNEARQASAACVTVQQDVIVFRRSLVDRHVRHSELTLTIDIHRSSSFQSRIMSGTVSIGIMWLGFVLRIDIFCCCLLRHVPVLSINHPLALCSLTYVTKTCNVRPGPSTPGLPSWKQTSNSHRPYRLAHSLR